MKWTTHEFAKHGARPCTVERVRAGKRFIAINGERARPCCVPARGKAKPNNLETIDEGN